MASLQCKMCGGAMEYYKVQNIAVCPYCGNKSTVFEQDKQLYEQFQNMFAALNNQKTGGTKEEGFWIETSREELIGEDGEIIQISFLTKSQVDLCTQYVARKNIIYVFKENQEEYAKRFIDRVSRLSYPNQEMEKELRQYVPKITAERKLLDGSMLIAIEKKDGVYPLKMLGILLDRHVAWIISRLENLCCLLEYNKLVLNAITIDNLFVHPEEHQIYLYGGWWFAGYAGTELVGASADAKQYIDRKQYGFKKNKYTTDLECIRLVAAKLLGYQDRKSLKADSVLPIPFRKFIVEQSEGSVGKDFHKWDKVLEKSYGERKYIPLSIEEEIYSREMIEEGENR